MSLELQERAEKITRELQEALIPLRMEIRKMKENSYPDKKIAK
jgi:hypothetical protein